MRRARDDCGSVTPMIIGFGLLLLSLVVVVVDASVAFLERQSLDNLADGAALYGADMAAEGTEVYGRGLGHGDLDLSVGAARRAVGSYLRDAGAYGDHPGLRAVVSVSGDTIVVRLTSSVDLPFTLPGGPGSASVSSTGSAVVRPD